MSTEHPYRDAAPGYMKKGWSPISLPTGKKSPPLTGHTGRAGGWVETPEDIERQTDEGRRNIAVRLPGNVVGLDVDSYGTKAGAATLAALEQRLGDLPAAPRSTSRPNDPVSGIRFFQVPHGRQWANDAGPGIEMVWLGHRYAVVAPSVHPEGGTYAWVDRDEPPAIEDLPELPAAWQQYLDQGDLTEVLPTVHVDTAAWRAELAADTEPCGVMRQALDTLRGSLTDSGSRHDAMVKAVGALVRHDEEGHRGVLVALDTAESLFEDAVTDRHTSGEFDRAVTGALAHLASGQWAATPGEDRGCCGMFARSSVRPLPAEDSSLAGYLAERHLRGRFLHSAQRGWFEWDGRRWRRGDEKDVAEVLRLAVIGELAEVQANEREAMRQGEEQGKAAKKRTDMVRRWATNAKNIAMVRLTKGPLNVDADTFELHPDLLNVGNGVVDLRTGRLRPHDPSLLLTNVTTTSYVPGATHPDWDKALEVVPQEVAAFLQVRLGQAITGHMINLDQVLFLNGGGGNGKSTIVQPVRVAAGDHCTVVPAKALLSSLKDHPVELMPLRGARLALLEELPAGAHIDSKRLKALAGTKAMDARPLYGEPTSWEASHTLVVTTNHDVTLTDNSYSEWRRVMPVPFERKFDDQEGEPKDTGLRPRLESTGPGSRRQREAVLAWLIEGARQSYGPNGEQDLPEEPPGQVTAMRDQWRFASDVVGQWLEEHTVPDPEGCMSSQDAYDDFVSFLHSTGRQRINDQTFAARLLASDWAQEYGIKKARKRVAKDGSLPGFPHSNRRFPPGKTMAFLTGVRSAGGGTGGDFDEI